MTSSTEPKTILLKGDPMPCEADAAATITPGMLLDIDTDGHVIPHGATSAVRFSVNFAREMELVGGGIDDNYLEGDRVLYYAAKPGDCYYALLENGANVAIGAPLASNAAGALEAAGANYAVAEALEAINNTSGGNVRIKVRVI